MRPVSVRLWIAPLARLAAALVIALGTLAIDRASDYGRISWGWAEGQFDPSALSVRCQHAQR
jgi:hypothetical protein